MQVRTALVSASLYLLSCATNCVGENDSTGGAPNGGAGQGGASAAGINTGGFACVAGGQGTLSVTTEVQASGFDYSDGMVVHATFGSYTPQNASDIIEDGAFSFSFDQPSTACSIGQRLTEPAAFYIDANGDGTCNLAEDYVFIWFAPALLSISASSQRCPPPENEYVTDRVVDAVRRLCPEIGSCIPF